MPTDFTGIVWLDAFLLVMGAWGYAVAFAGALLENLFLAGSVVPGETVVMAVAFVASKDPRLNIVVVWLISVFGTMAGSNISYWIGHRGGRPLLDRIVARFPRLMHGMHDAEEYFEIHGTKTVFIARFTAGFKNFVPTLAGVTRMKLLPFEIYTFLSAVVYTTGLALLGYFFGSNLDLVGEWMNKAGVWALVALAVAVAVYVAYRRWRTAGIERQVEAHEAEAGANDDTTGPEGRA
ncbi:MAG: DedA family protein [Coriobacteriia bacterium]|nr:DedA family protein [Coriobacteriia bacterium]